MYLKMRHLFLASSVLFLMLFLITSAQATDYNLTGEEQLQFTGSGDIIRYVTVPIYSEFSGTSLNADGHDLCYVGGLWVSRDYSPDYTLNGGSATLSGNYVFDTVSITNGATVTCTGCTIYANSFTLDSTSSINLDGYGSSGGSGFSCASGQAKDGWSGDGYGDGGGGDGKISCGTYGNVCASGAGGAGFGNTGVDGGDVDSIIYGGDGGDEYSNPSNPQYLEGSGGGGGSCASANGGSVSAGDGGDGGGAIKIVSNYIQIAGTISADGEDGEDCHSLGGSGDSACGGSGGGSGGNIILEGETIQFTGGTTLTATGGYRGSATGRGSYTRASGGSGAGGRIKILYTSWFSGGGTFDVSDGAGGSHQGTVYSGTISALENVYFTTNPYYKVSTLGGNDWSYSGVWKGVSVTSITSKLNNAIGTSYTCAGGTIIGNNCSIPITFHSDTAGTLTTSMYSYTNTLLYLIHNIAISPASNIKIGDNFTVNLNVTNPTTASANVNLTYPNSTILTYSTTHTSEESFVTANITAITDGFYSINATSNDGHSNITNFTVPDASSYSPSSYTGIVNAGDNYTINTAIYPDSSHNLSFTYNCDFANASTFTCYFPNNPFYVQGSGNQIVTIESNISALSGTYYGNITITRDIDNKTVKTIPLTLSIIGLYGQPYIVNKTDWSPSLLNTEVATIYYTLNNTGQYNLTNCTGILTTDFVNASWATAIVAPDNLAIGELGQVQIVLNQPPASTYQGYLDVDCIAGAGNEHNTLAGGNQPFIVATVTQGGGGGGGGGGGTTIINVTRVEFLTYPKTVDTYVLYLGEKAIYNIRSSRVLKSCSTENKDFSCSANATASSVRLDAVMTNTFYKMYSTRLTLISVDDEVTEIPVYFRVINPMVYIPTGAISVSRTAFGLNYFFEVQNNTLMGIRLWWISLIILSLLILGVRAFSSKKPIGYSPF